MNWYKKAKLEGIPEYLQKMFGLGKYEPKTKYHNCPKCGNSKAKYIEMHPDTDMNEIVEYCPDCGEIEEVKKDKTTQSSLVQSLTKKAKKDKEYLTPDEREQIKNRFGEDLECSFAKDKDGYYCHTHRARSDSYPSIDKIPKFVVEFIGSTG